MFAVLFSWFFPHTWWGFLFWLDLLYQINFMRQNRFYFFKISSNWFDQTKMCQILLYTFLYLFDSINLIKLISITWYFPNNYQGPIQRFWKGGTLYVGHHGWSAKKKLGFRWSKKVEITLETRSFWQNIPISIFKFSTFLSMKSYQFFKIY